MKNITEMLKGILEGCVLEIISQKETYGYDITQQLRELGFDDVVEGTVYTITTRLEKNNLVNVEKRASTIGPPRKFYSLNGDFSGRNLIPVFDSLIELLEIASMKNQSIEEVLEITRTDVAAFCDNLLA